MKEWACLFAPAASCRMLDLGAKLLTEGGEVEQRIRRKAEERADGDGSGQPDPSVLHTPSTDQVCGDHSNACGSTRILRRPTYPDGQPSQQIIS